MSTYTPPKWLRILIPLILVVTWFSLSAIGGPYFGRIEEVSEVDLAAFLPESAEATKVNNELSKFRDTSTLPAIVVFKADDDTLSTAQRDRIGEEAKKIQDIEGVSGSVSPAIVSDDGSAAFLSANINEDAGIQEVTEKIRETIKDEGPEGVTTYVTGPAGFAADLNTAFAGIDGILLITALSVVFVILITVYRSLLLPIMVLLTSIMALSASILIVFTLAKAGLVELNGQVQGILFILVIGAATDYSLLYVSRYREALYKQKDVWRASLDAYKGALEPIIASGGTVVVGLLCLLLSDLASNKALGPVGAIGIVMAVVSSLTFLPAVLVLLGRVAFWPSVPRAELKARTEYKKKREKGIWHKVGQLVDRHSRRTWLVSGALLLIAAAFITQLRADGVAQSDLIVGPSEARDGQGVLSESFAAGSGSPAQVIVKRDKQNALVQTIDNVRGVDGVSVAATGTDTGFLLVGASSDDILGEIRSTITEQYAATPEPARSFLPPIDTVVQAANPFKDANAKVVDDKVLLSVVLSDAPDSDAAKETITRLRQATKAIDESAIVGGVTATQLDTTTASIRDRTVIIPVVLIAITIILMVLLRSIVAPILLLLTTVVSFAASLGVASVLFDYVWKFPGADPSVVLYGFVFLVALGIDYNIFLMTRVREESLKRGTARGVIKGLIVTGGVITSAGVVLAATFAALGVIPILFLFQLAFIVAFGVLLDTLIVRSLLVPALVRDIGSFVWWPSKVKD